MAPSHSCGCVPRIRGCPPPLNTGYRERGKAVSYIIIAAGLAVVAGDFLKDRPFVAYGLFAVAAGVIIHSFLSNRD